MKKLIYKFYEIWPIILFSFIVLSVLSTICYKAATEDYSIITLQAKVTDVRILVSQRAKTNEDDTIPGAIVGGLVAGKTGAIIGAIAGKGDNRTTVINEISECQFKAIVKDELLTFRAWGDHIDQCAMLKENDEIKLEKYKDGYCWSEVTGISPGCVMGR